MDRTNYKKIVFFSNTFWSLYNFRRRLITTLIVDGGCEVFVMSADDPYRELLESLGCKSIILKNMNQKGRHLNQEVKLIYEIYSRLKKINYDCLLSYTIKPNAYGNIANYLLKKKNIVTVNGLGNAFVGKIQTRVSLILFRWIFRWAKHIVFQNREDYDFLQKHIFYKVQKKVTFVRGSGVDLRRFSLKRVTKFNRNWVRFLMSCRMLKEKGINEYLQAAKRIKQRYPKVLFFFLGMEAINASAVSKDDIDVYVQDGTVRYLEKTDNIEEILQNIDVLVLPSYYNEGVPKTLLEGLAMGIPIITTDSVGCRETVNDGENGFLIQPKDIEGLFLAMKRIIEIPFEERIMMSKASRKKAELEFDEEQVVKKYIEIIYAL